MTGNELGTKQDTRESRTTSESECKVECLLLLIRPHWPLPLEGLRRSRAQDGGASRLPTEVDEQTVRIEIQFKRKASGEELDNISDDCKPVIP